MAQGDSDVQDVSKFSAEVSAHSHLVFSKLKQYKGVIFWEHPDLPDILPSDFDVYQSLGVADRIDNIAAVLYGDPLLWWALSLANDIRLPPLEMNPGFVIRLVDNKAILRAIRESVKV